MLNRNVGHLMTNPSIKLNDGSEILGIMDAFITTAAAIHDFKNKKTQENSFYIVKPKYGPDEVSFANLIFEKVKKV